MAKSLLFFLVNRAAVDQFSTEKAGTSLDDQSNLPSDEAGENGRSLWFVS